MYYITANGISNTDGEKPPADEIDICVQWIRLFVKPRKTINTKTNSYGLKHKVEKWAYKYVCNGALIRAMKDEGYNIQRIGNSPNAQFNISLPNKRGEKYKQGFPDRAEEYVTYHNYNHIPKCRNLKTKTTLGKEGLKPGGEPVGSVITGYGQWELYDADEAVEKRPMTDAQKESLKKAREASIKYRCCDECGLEVLRPGQRRRGTVLLCEYCKHDRFLARERVKASDWARKMLSEKTFILDTETTGLDDDAQIIEIAICDTNGTALFNRMVKPTVSIEPGASEVHGITDDDVAELPGWGKVWPELYALIVQADNLVIYNRDFDMRMIDQACEAYDVGLKGFQWDDYTVSPPEKPKLWCAMLQYAAWYGEWSVYHESFTWQPLNGGHDALDDCRATLELMREMAEEK